MSKMARVFPLFGVAFAVIYVFVLEYNLALFTYFPALNVWRPLNPPPGPSDGPGMYWYGIIVTSAIIAAVVALIGAFIPDNIRAKAWSGLTWVVPVCAMVAILWILRGYFNR
jgi:hypothetical protein